LNYLAMAVRGEHEYRMIPLSQCGMAEVEAGNE
jgi:hypothetical protein